MGIFRNKYFLLLTIIFIGALLRLAFLSSAVPSLNQDELVGGYDSWCLAQNLHDHHGVLLPFIPESFGDWTSPFINYISLPFLKVMGLTEWSVRFPISLLGIASIFLFYLFIKRILGNVHIALLAAFLFATAPFAITISRWAVPPATVPFTLLLFLNSFFWAIEKQGYWRFILTAFAGVFVVYSYPTMKLFFPLMAALLFVIYFKEIKWKALPGILLFVLLISPLYYLALKYPEIYNARFKNISLAAGHEAFVPGFISRYIGYFSPYFYFGKGDEFVLHHVPGFGSIHEFLAFFSYAGIAFIIANAFKKLNFIERRFSIFLLLAFLIAPMPACLTIHKYTSLRNIHTILFMHVFAVIGIHFIVQNISNPFIKKIVYATIIVVISCSTLNYSYYYFRQYKYEAQDEYHYGLKEIFFYLKQNENHFDKVEINTSNDDTGILEPYIYYLFYNKIAPGTYDAKTMSTQLGKYYFNPINPETYKGLQPLFIFPFGKYGFTYKIYEPEKGRFVVTK